MKTLNVSCHGCSPHIGTVFCGSIELTALLMEMIAFSIGIALRTDGSFIAVVEFLLFVNILRVFLLILGSIKEKLWLMIPWIGTQIIYFISIPILLAYFFSSFIRINKMILGTIGVFISAGIFFYYFLMVVSRFEEIRDKQAKKKYGASQNERFPQNSLSLV